MSTIINTNGQPATPTPTPAAESPTPKRQAIAPAEMQRVIGVYARLKELSAATILTPNDQAEQKGCIDFLHNALLQNAEELFGAWVAINQEYSPLIQGFTALLNRALARIDNQNRVQEVKS